MNSSIKIKIKNFSEGENSILEDFIAVEEPIEITLIYGNESERISKPVSVTMRTPGNDNELALGFLFTEGIIKSFEQISEVIIKEENKIHISLQENVLPDILNAERNFYTSSSCGVCGKSIIDSVRTVSVYNTTIDEISLNREIFYGLNEVLRSRQTVFDSTGGLHASALFDTEGIFIMLREDVGRHNALDKIIGNAFMNNILPLNDKILLLSGRASFELIQKAAMAGIKIVAAIGAPSSLAVQMAVEAEITLIGFLKNERFNVYSGEQRIKI